jgi:hypothetical protein
MKAGRSLCQRFRNHGGKDKDGNWNSPPSLLQFKNVYVKELK